MPDILDEDFVPSPPSPERVAARALILAAVSCRALTEKDAGKPGAEELRQGLLPWLDAVGATDELEPAEIDLISTPLGELDPKTRLNAGWQSEGMAALAWVLGYAELPPVHVQCEPSDIANIMGFLDDRENTPMHSPRLRDDAEIDRLRDTCLTLHWRLRQRSFDPAPMDFVAYVAACTWGALRLDDLEILNNDLAIDGVAIDKLNDNKYHEVLSITQERHQALNWLLGFENLYSQVTTDT
jgi:hypothetical protein